MKNMKKVKLPFLFVLCLITFTGCNTNDNSFYYEEYLTIPNLTQIQTQSSYAVGDYLFINSNINRLQSETGQNTLLDLRKSTGNATSFDFTYLLEKQIDATNWALVDASPANIILTSGGFTYETGNFYNANALFNPISDKYEFNVGIKLTSSGNYRLSFGYNSSSTNSVEYRSNSVGNNLFMNINSIISNLDTSGYYNFTVN